MVACLAIGAPALHAQTAAPATPVDTTNVALARELVGASRLAELIHRDMELAVSEEQVAKSPLPGAVWAEVRTEVKAARPRLVERLVPLYVSRFSRDELAQLVAFYQTPLGQRLAAEQLAISREARDVQARVSARIASEVTIRRRMRGEPTLLRP
jgi:hypothetical protein